MAAGSVDMEGCGVKRRSARAHAVQVDGPLLLTETGRSSFIARQIQTLISHAALGGHGGDGDFSWLASALSATTCLVLPCWLGVHARSRRGYDLGRALCGGDPGQNS